MKSKWIRFAGVIALAVIFFLGFFSLLGVCLGKLPEPIGSRAELLNLGARATLNLTLVSGGLGLLIGLILGLGEISILKIFRWPAEFVVWVIRGTPLLVQILFMYLALPMLFPWAKFDEFTAGAAALSLNVGAYNAEVIRAGIIAVPRGQTEAARSLGLSHLQSLVFVVLPQAFRIVIPPLVNNGVALLKDSSLVGTIGLLELAQAGNRISAETFQPVPVLATVAAVYLILTTVLTWMTSYLERLWRS